MHRLRNSASSTVRDMALFIPVRRTSPSYSNAVAASATVYFKYRAPLGTMISDILCTKLERQVLNLYLNQAQKFP